MADRRTIVFFPEGAFGPTNNCVGIGNVLRERGHRVVFIVEERFAGTLEAQGLRGAADAPRPAARGARGPRPVLDRLHPGHRARLPQDDPRAARAVHGPDLAGPHRRLEVRRRRGSARSSTSSRRTSSSRTTWSPSRPCRRAAGRGSASCRATRPSSRTRPSRRSRRATRPRTDRLAGVPRRGPAHPRRHVGRVRRVLREHGAPGLTYGAAGPGLHARVAVPRPVPLPGRGRLRARAGRSARRGTGWIRASGRPTRRGRCRRGWRAARSLIYLSLGSLGSADVGLMQRLVDVLGADRPPGHRVARARSPTRSRSTTT